MSMDKELHRRTENRAYSTIEWFFYRGDWTELGLKEADGRLFVVERAPGFSTKLLFEAPDRETGIGFIKLLLEK